MSLLELLDKFPSVKTEPSKRAKKRAAYKRSRIRNMKQQSTESTVNQQIKESIPSALSEVLGIIKKNPSYEAAFSPTYGDAPG